MDLIKNGESSQDPWRSIESDSDQLLQQEALALRKVREQQLRRYLGFKGVTEGDDGQTSEQLGKTRTDESYNGQPEVSALRQSSNSRYGPAVIELRGSSEDGEDLNKDPMSVVNKDPMLVVNHARVMETKRRPKPRKPKREKLAAPNPNLMRDCPIIPSFRAKGWISEPEEVEEVLEKGNPPRKPARHVNSSNSSKRRKLDQRPSDQGPSTIASPPSSSSPINLVSSSPSGPFPTHHNIPSRDSSLSPPPSAFIEAEAETLKRVRSSPAARLFQDPSTPRPTPTPAPPTPAPVAPDPPIPKRDFQREILSALDAIYDGERNRVAMREHEVFNLLSHLHVPEDQMAVMLTWERNTRQWGQMYFTKQVEYITRYIDTYGHIIDQYGSRVALKFHFGRLLAEGRLCPPYQSTPSHLSVEERTDIQNSSALRVFNAVCRALNAYQPPRRE